uniref:Uncharacterized protein n=1 Tax=Romanomermis culicivorax TaxID=13658 RepID=A0A915HVV8_ROMCU
MTASIMQGYYTKLSSKNLISLILNSPVKSEKALWWIDSKKLTCFFLRQSNLRRSSHTLELNPDLVFARSDFTLESLDPTTPNLRELCSNSLFV